MKLDNNRENPMSNKSSSRPTKPFRGRLAVLAAAGVTGGAAVLAAGSFAIVTPAHAAVLAPSPTALNYTGAVQEVTVPQGVSTVYVDAIGGGGGLNLHPSTYVNPGFGAEVTGAMAVTPGEQLDVYVGNKGADASWSDDDPTGGWSAPGYGGGNGNAASDTYRTSGAGGGATVITDADTGQVLLVAAGGGGNGGPSGDPGNQGGGGTANTWAGGLGGQGTIGPQGGKGGAGGAQPTGQGARGQGGSGLGGNGGGGGGGVKGGSGGSGAKGTSAGGGGGSGSSMVDSSVIPNPTIKAHGDSTVWDGTAGSVSLTWLS
jgi:Glycine rich protein